MCGGESGADLFLAPDRLHGVPGSYRYVRCGRCASAWQSPMVVGEDLPLCYPHDYYTHGGEAGGEEEVASNADADADAGAGSGTGDGFDAAADPGAGGGAGGGSDADADARADAGVDYGSDADADARADAGDRSVAIPRGAAGTVARATRRFRDRLRRWIRWAVQGGLPPALAGRLLGRMLSVSRALRERAFFGLVDPVIPTRPHPGRALEVGPGGGWELGLLVRVGWEAQGVEFDPAASVRAEAAHGVRVRTGDFLEVVGPDEAFDLIYLSHVVEHLPDPERAFRFFREHLRPGGRAVLVFPNLHSLGARLWGAEWWGWDPPRHLVLPSLRGVHVLAEKAGLRATVETRARTASFVRAGTRRLRGGDPGPVRKGLADHAFGAAEGLLVALGASLGEEALVVLEARRRERG